MILKDLSNLLDNFLLSRWIIRLRASNQIISLIAYLRTCCQWTLANCSWYAWAKIICSRRISLIRFIFWTNRSTCIHFECSITFFWVFFDFNLIRECCSKLARNDVHWVLSKKWLLMTNSADDSHAAQSLEDIVSKRRWRSRFDHSFLSETQLTIELESSIEYKVRFKSDWQTEFHDLRRLNQIIHDVFILHDKKLELYLEL